MTTESVSSAAELSDSIVGAVEMAAKHVACVEGRRRSPASGVHLRKGLVVTADHVLESDEGIVVRLEDQKMETTLVGRDPTTDLALLKVSEDGLQEPAQPNREPARVGQLVLAVAHPGDVGVSVSFGSISAVGGSWRTWAGGKVDQLIKPDVTFYPGFSGGPLVDLSGTILGINTSGLSRSMSLTLPISTVDRVEDGLLKTGKISRGYLGLRMQSVPLPEGSAANLGLASPRGLLVVAVESGGPAEQAGILVGDILVGIGDKAVTESDSVQAILDPETVGKPVALRILRGGSEARIDVTVGERPTHEGRHGRRRHGGHHRG